MNKLYSDRLSFLIDTQLYRENKLSGSLADANYDMVNFFVNTSYKVRPRLVVSPKLQLQSRNFKEIDPLYLRTRKDNEYQFLLNSTYTLDKNFLFSCDYSYINHTSNIQTWVFSKHVISANMIVAF
jgi:predicted porin